jgi:hypothetical protein
MSNQIVALVVEFSDGSRWEISAMVIARQRAFYYANLDASRGEGDFGDLFDKELAYTLSDKSELLDWARNNMNWSDVEKFATELPRYKHIDKQAEWPNADMEVK